MTDDSTLSALVVAPTIDYYPYPLSKTWSNTIQNLFSIQDSNQKLLVVQDEPSIHFSSQHDHDGSLSKDVSCSGSKMRKRTKKTSRPFPETHFENRMEKSKVPTNWFDRHLDPYQIQEVEGFSSASEGSKISSSDEEYTTLPLSSSSSSSTSSSSSSSYKGNRRKIKSGLLFPHIKRTKSSSVMKRMIKSNPIIDVCRVTATAAPIVSVDRPIVKLVENKATLLCSEESKTVTSRVKDLESIVQQEGILTDTVVKVETETEADAITDTDTKMESSSSAFLASLMATSPKDIETLRSYGLQEEVVVRLNSNNSNTLPKSKSDDGNRSKRHPFGAVTVESRPKIRLCASPSHAVSCRMISSTSNRSSLCFPIDQKDGPSEKTKRQQTQNQNPLDRTISDQYSISKMTPKSPCQTIARSCTLPSGYTFSMLDRDNNNDDDGDEEEVPAEVTVFSDLFSSSSSCSFSRSIGHSGSSNSLSCNPSKGFGEYTDSGSVRRGGGRRRGLKIRESKPFHQVYRQMNCSVSTVSETLARSRSVSVPIDDDKRGSSCFLVDTQIHLATSSSSSSLFINTPNNSDGKINALDKTRSRRKNLSKSLNTAETTTTLITSHHHHRLIPLYRYSHSRSRRSNVERRESSQCPIFDACLEEEDA